MILHYLRIFRWHVLRYVAHHRLLALLNVVSVGLGVSVYLAIQIANVSASRAFAATVDVVAGKAQIEIRGGPGGLPDDVFPRIAGYPGISAATPIVGGILTLPDFPGEYLQVLGVDVFTNTPFRTFELTDFTNANDFDIQSWLADPEAIAVTDEFARMHRLKAGDRMRVQVNATERTLRVGFVMGGNGSAVMDSHFAAMDIGWAQELFARRGFLNSIQLQFRDGVDRNALIGGLRPLAPPDARIAPPAQRNEEVEKMLGGFRLNLTAMSLVSLLVGTFLVYNTVSASVVRRRSEIGALRSLGVTRNEVRALFLGEALVLGLVGTLLGLAGGFALALFLIGTVSETISTLYVLINVRELAVTPAMLFSAVCAGLVSVLIAAWLPAAAAARMDPVRALRAGSIIEQSADLSAAWFWSGVTFLVLTIGFCAVALITGPAWISFVAAFCVLAGFSLVVPEVTACFSRALARLGGKSRRLESHLAAGNLARSLARNSVTIAALAAAVSMTIGLTVMVFSFRQTVATWIGQTLMADLLVRPATVAGASFMPESAIRLLEAHPAVAAVATFREVEISGPGKAYTMVVFGEGERRHFQFLHGDEREIMRRFAAEPCVLISEAFARKNQVQDGQALELFTPEGLRRFPIAGTVYDYSRDEGVVFMNARTFVSIWKDERVNSVGLFLKPGLSTAEAGSELRTALSREGQFMIVTNREVRRRVLEIFDQTFAVTYILRSIAVIVAIAGICLTLMTLITERTRELALFRAGGGSVAQLRKVLLWECAFLGLLAAIVGLASGLCLSLVMTGVINRAYFGWTIQLAFPWSSLAATPLWIVTAAVLAGIVPALAAGRMKLADALRTE